MILSRENKIYSPPFKTNPIMLYNFYVQIVTPGWKISMLVFSVFDN